VNEGLIQAFRQNLVRAKKINLVFKLLSISRIHCFFPIHVPVR
jgi:hypothetical protein